MTENTHQEATLYEALPVRSGEAGKAWCERSFDVDPEAAAAVRALGSTAATQLLAAALALSEAQLTGRTKVEASAAMEDASLVGREVSLDPGSTVRAWVDGFFDHGAWHRAMQSAEPCWAAVHPSLPSGACTGSGAGSTWQLQLADAACLVGRYRTPWTAESIEVFASLVLRVLRALCKDAAARLCALDLLDPADRDRQVVEWNRGDVQCWQRSTVPGVFAGIAAARPHATAVMAGSVDITYAELDERSSRLASRLVAEGVAVGDVVGVAMGRSAEAVVVLLAVLKAGAVYLPLDTVHPAERIAFMLQDARVRVVVCNDPGAMPFPDGAVIVHPGDCKETGGPVIGELPVLDGEALAYVMYTSGSTGQPKGVEIRHRSILRLVMDADYIELGPDTKFLHAAPLGFDASTLEIWGPLLNGGSVVVHEEAVPTACGLATVIDGKKVTTVWLTAALFNAVVDEKPLALGGVRQLFTGGEALSPDHVRRMRSAAPHVVVHNAYGPTECTTFTTTHRIGTIDAGATSVSIGRPIGGTSVYVFNPAGQLQPRGAVGELHIGGEGLARGYLGRPELTAERFVGHPFKPGEQLYRTGDLVRWNEHGELEFVGRIDGQVKIRGFRIEPGEIESQLASHPDVQACAVLAVDDRHGGKRLVAYVVNGPGSTIDIPSLRRSLAKSLPDFMVPARFVQLDALPVTANGKLDRRALPVPDRSRPQTGITFEPARGSLEQALVAVFEALLDIDGIGRNDNFFELGGSSLLAAKVPVKLAERIAGKDGTPVTHLFQHPTPASYAAALQPQAAAAQPQRIMRTAETTGRVPIAIIGMAGRFPGAPDVETFWQNLCEGRDSISRFEQEELDPSIPAEERTHPDYVAARGVIDDVECFDAAFFGISAREAELMDPQHRIFLELCWECLERAGHVPDRTPMPVGVFAGMYNATYFQKHLAGRPDLVQRLGAFQVMLDNEKDYIATRVAHKLDLTGPAVSVHTACSTSLVAICQAMDSLRAGRCGMALAGGASVTCPPRSGYRYQEGSMLSPDGRTRSFDAEARGTVFSDGAAVVLLKRLDDAIADGDPIHAVVRGGAVNNDGARKASFTAPSADAQAAVIAMAHADAGVTPAEVGYVEAHGTATPLGDPIEIDGLRMAFGERPRKAGRCRLGSVKSNVGHTVIAAGATGVIKTALSLQQGRIPASLHFDKANPDLRLEDSPFVVNDRMHDWANDASPRIAGVSSFGVGGTNAHVVLEEPPAREASDPAEGPQLLVLSARNAAAVARSAARLADHLASAPETNLADVAWTLAKGRKAFPQRAAIVAGSSEEAVVKLREFAGAPSRDLTAADGGVVFMFPGQGAQYPDMGRALHASQPAFRAAFDACAEALLEPLGFDLRDVVFGDDADALLPTSVMQPAIFAVEYALARTWMALGVEPVAMLGHSVGEFVAATIAGVFELPDALRLVAERGRLMQAQPSGGMLSVRLPYTEVEARLPAELSMAAENAPGSCVVAGPLAALDTLRAQLDSEQVANRMLRTSHAFHSSMMDSVVAPFRAAVDAVALAAPRIPIVSTVDADWLDGRTARSADYWARHLRQPVRFAPAVAKVLDTRARLLLEVGPRSTLASLAKQQALARHDATAIASLSDAPGQELHAMLAAAGHLWCRGAAIDPALFDRRRVRHRVRLPTYPFEKQRYWVEAGASAPTESPAHTSTAAMPAQMHTSATADMEFQMPQPYAATTPAPTADRKPRIVAELAEIFEDVTGFEITAGDSGANFIELGLDSLMLTQVALQLQKRYPAKVTFRQLMGECGSLASLADMLDAELPADAVTVSTTQAQAAPSVPAVPLAAPPAGVLPPAMPAIGPAIAGNDFARQLIAQQMQLMSQQLALLGGGNGVPSMPLAVPAATDVPPVDPAPPAPSPSPVPTTPMAPPANDAGSDEDEARQLAHTRYDVKKAFGAIARIDNNARFELSPRQRGKLDAFITRYTARTAKSKQYTTEHRDHMADPRVVNGFRPLLKELTYQIVIERSKGSHLTDLDRNDYVDALNGFGMSLFGWQPDFVLDAVKRQLDLGYEIGPQHPLAGEVAKLVCEVTGHDRAALCNTGSEAVLGALRIARTVTGRETVVVFNGAYHGIIDEMIVRGTSKLRAVPAAPGILRNTAEHVLVLDYGTPESMKVIRERAGEIAAILVEPVQSRRPDFQPVAFLEELRQVATESGALLVFDEVVTGFRAHPAGAQGLFNIKADLATYGKVVGGGYPIGVIAGQRRFMDALDGGHWQFGDDSVPTVGVTYFAGTFVRHPLALAAAKAVLEHVKSRGPAMQQALNQRVTALAAELNAFCNEVGAPIEIRHFASVWKTFFLEDHPLQDLLFAMMRSRGVHILDNFPCFFTTAHGEEDFVRIATAFKESVGELQEAEFLPRRASTTRTVMDPDRPAVAGARLGRDPDGNPAWFIPNPDAPGKYLKVG